MLVLSTGFMSSKTKILLIEDNEDIREIMKDMLTMRGYDIYEARDGPIGIRDAISKNPSLIICDIMMPTMDGFEVLLSLRKLEQFATTPFIFVTANADNEVHREAMNLGADDFLTKPFSANDLLASVETRIEKQRNQTTEEQRPTESYVFPARLSMDKITVSSELLIKYGDEMKPEESMALFEEIHSTGFRISKQLENYWIYNLLRKVDYSEALSFYFDGNQSCSLGEAIRAALENKLLRTTGNIELEIPDQNLAVAMSPKALEKIIVEILDNAFVYRDKGTKVKAEISYDDKSCSLRIGNQTSDLSPEDLHEIKPFEKLHSSNPDDGVGLGLYISEKILEHFHSKLCWSIGEVGWIEIEISIPLAI